jgi:hypothetical protein
MLLDISNKNQIVVQANLPDPGVNPLSHPEFWNRGKGELSGIPINRSLLSLELRETLYSAGLELDYIMAFSWIAERVGAQTPWHCDGRSYRDKPQLCSINWQWSPGTCIEIAKEWDDGNSDPTNYAWRVWENLAVEETLTIYDNGPFLMNIQWPHRVNLLNTNQRKSLVLRFKNNPSYSEVFEKMKKANLINEL